MSEIKTLTKQDIVELLHEKIGFNKSECRQLLVLTLEQMRRILAEGKHVKVSRFGNFEVRFKKERPGRNPKTGEPAVVSARKVVIFHASRALKERVYSGHGTS